MADRMSTIEEKMATMRLKNLELLKRHQEIERDRQLAQQQTGSISSIATPSIEKMKGARKNRTRTAKAQENSNESTWSRPIVAVRRKLENTQSNTKQTQRVDYHRVKSERNQLMDSKAMDNNHDADEPAHAKKLVIVNNQVDRIGSGRFTQQSRTKEPVQRMHRCPLQTNESHAGNNEFHLDVSTIPMWHNNSLTPVHVQLVSTTGLEHLVNSNGEPMERSHLEPTYLPNYIYPSAGQHPSAFNSNGTIYFAPPPPPGQPHFHQYHQPRTFENSNHQQFHHFPTYLPPHQTYLPPPTTTTISDRHHLEDNNHHMNLDGAPRFRHLKPSEHQRPKSIDFDRPTSLMNSNHDNRFHSRPQSYYENSNRSHRYPQRNYSNHNQSLPLSAYMNTDDDDSQANNWNSSSTHQKRRINPTKNHQHDKHQFPLSLYDPRQYDFSHQGQRRNDSNNRRQNNAHQRRRNPNQIDLIEEWWEDDANTQLIGTTPKHKDDSGHSSLSNSLINVKETSFDEDEENPGKTMDNIDASSPSTNAVDHHILQSLDQLQQQLKFEEILDECLSTAKDDPSNHSLIDSIKQSGTYNTAHFLQWAKKTFRDELAGRLTAQEIQQHDAVTEDESDEQLKDSIDHLDGLPDDLNKKLMLDTEHANATTLSIG